MKKIKSWLDQHQKIKAILYWPGWPMALVTFFVLYVIAGDLMYFCCWLWLWIKSSSIADAVLKHYLAMLAELRQYKQLNMSAPAIAGVGMMAVWLINKNHNGIPDVMEKREHPDFLPPGNIGKGGDPHDGQGQETPRRPR